MGGRGRGTRLRGYGLGEQSLAVAWWAEEQHTARRGTQPREYVGAQIGQDDRLPQHLLRALEAEYITEVHACEACTGSRGRARVAQRATAQRAQAKDAAA